MLPSEITADLSNRINNHSCGSMRERSNTFPTACSDLSRIRNTVINFKRQKSLLKSNTASISNPSQEIDAAVKLVPLVTTETSIFNAKDYVYLGGSETSFPIDMGATLDKSGRLQLIKSQPRGVISGIYNKYVNKKNTFIIVFMG